MRSARREWWRSRWATPAYCLAIGSLVAAAMWIGCDRDSALRSFAIFVVLAALFAFGGRSDTVRGIGVPGRDERWVAIDLRATAFAGVAVTIALIGAWLWELAHGQDGGPYGQIMAIGGIAYLIAIAFLRWRS